MTVCEPLEEAKKLLRHTLNYFEDDYATGIDLESIRLFLNKEAVHE